MQCEHPPLWILTLYTQLLYCRPLSGSGQSTHHSRSAIYFSDTVVTSKPLAQWMTKVWQHSFIKCVRG